MFKDILDSVKKGGNNCPIVLEKLTLNILSQYLTTRRNKKQKHIQEKFYGGIQIDLCHLYWMGGVTIGHKF